MAKTIENLFVYLVFITDILVLLFFIINYSNCKKHKTIIAIVSYCTLDILVNLIAEFSSSNRLVYISYAFFTAYEYSVFAFILSINIKNKIFKKVITAVSFVFILFLFGYYSTSNPRSIDSIPIGIETILIIMYSFYYLYEQMNNTNELFIYSKYQFWIIVGIMLYLAGSFFIYIFANQVDRVMLDNFWFLTMVFYVIKNIFFCIGIYNVINIKNKKNKILKPYLN